MKLVGVAVFLFISLCDVVDALSLGHPYAGCPTMRSWSDDCAGDRWSQLSDGSYQDEDGQYRMTVSDGLYTCCAVGDYTNGACAAGKEVDERSDLFSCKISAGYCDEVAVLNAEDSRCVSTYAIGAPNEYNSDADINVTLVVSSGPLGVPIWTCYSRGEVVEVVLDVKCENYEFLDNPTVIAGDQNVRDVPGTGGENIYVVFGYDVGGNMDIAEDLVTFELVVPEAGLEVYVTTPLVLDTAFVSVANQGGDVNIPVVQFIGNANHFTIKPTPGNNGSDCPVVSGDITVRVMMAVSGSYSRDGGLGEVGVSTATVAGGAATTTVAFDAFTSTSCIAQVIAQPIETVPIPITVSNVNNGTTATSKDFTLRSSNTMTNGDVITFAYFCVDQSKKQVDLFPGAYLQSVSYSLGAEGVAVTDNVTANQPTIPSGAGGLAKTVFVTQTSVVSDDGDYLLTYDRTEPKWSVFPRKSTCSSATTYSGASAVGFEVIIPTARIIPPDPTTTSTTTPATTTTSTTVTAARRGGLSTGAIVGIAVGVSAAAIGIGVGVWFIFF